MSSAYEITGRRRQKARTRNAMLGAARELLAEGDLPTVERVAERAGVSRSTAYRYFPNQHLLMMAAYPRADAGPAFAQRALEDPVARLDVALDHIERVLRDHEPELRAMLRLALDPSVAPEALVLRQGRAIRWIEDALEPLRAQGIGGKPLRRLAIAIRAAFGIEPLVWLTDVASLDRDAAFEVMRSTAHVLLRDALGTVARAG